MNKKSLIQIHSFFVETKFRAETKIIDTLFNHHTILLYHPIIVITNRLHTVSLEVLETGLYDHRDVRSSDRVRRNLVVLQALRT